MTDHAPAREPEDLARFFVERANAGDLTGIVALYEPTAVLEFPIGTVANGHDEIRAVYARFLTAGPHLAPGTQRPALRKGNLALTSSRLGDGAITGEVARRQPDGTWLWILDCPDLTAET